MKNLRTILLCGLASLLTAVVVAQGQVPGVNSTLNSVFTLAYDNSTMKPTYSATVANAAPVASAQDVCTLSGSATKTVKVRRIYFNAQTTATQVSELVSIVKRSTANTVGGGATLLQASYDSSNPAGTVGLAEVWTQNPTAGTLAAVLADIALPFPVLSGTALVTPYLFEYGRLGQPIVLRGVAQSVSINLGGVTVTGTFSCIFEWTEE